MSLTRRGQYLGLAGTLLPSFQIGGSAGPKIAVVNGSLQLQDVDGNPVASEALAPIHVKADSATLALVDAGSIVEMAKASAQTITVPPNVTVQFPIGSMVEVVQTGAGELTVVAGAGVTLVSAKTLVAIRQHARIYLYKQAVNTWQVSGDLIPTQAALTLTFATADATLAASTGLAYSQDFNDGGVAASGDPTAASLASVNALANFADGQIGSLATQHNNLVDDVEDLKRFVVSLVNGLKANKESGIA